MKGKLVGCDWELSTLTLQFENLDAFVVSKRFMDVHEAGYKDAQIKLLKEALEFYANKYSYYLVKDSFSECRRSIELSDTESLGTLDERGNNFLEINGGRRAREALKKLEEMEGTCQLTEEI